LFHIRPVERRRMQPPYCFHGATATCWLRSVSLRLIPDTFWTEAQPITLMPAHPHSVSEPHTHAPLLPLFPSLLATGSGAPCLRLRSRYFPSFLLPKPKPKMFSRKGNTTTPSGFRNYHQTLFKGTDGRCVYTSAAEFAWRSTDLVDHVTESPRSTHSPRGFDGDRRCEHLRPSH